MVEHEHDESAATATFGEQDDSGFTLIELMVVVLVIAILLAIAVPTFLGARERSQDRAAQSSLRNALTAAKVLFVDSGDYSGVTKAALDGVEPALTFNATSGAASGDDNVVSFHQTDTDFYAAALSESSSCFFIRDKSDSTGADAGTQYAEQTTGVIACTGAQAALAAFQTSYDGSWQTD